MEFTKKRTPVSLKSSSLRRSPYPSSGQSFLQRYQNRAGKGASPRALYATPDKEGQGRVTSRGEKMVSSSLKSLPQADEANTLAKWIERKSPQAVKRPFSAVNGGDTSKDNYSDDEIFLHPRKEIRSSPVSDKENSLFGNDSIFGSPKSSSVKVYSNKKKPLNLNRSRLLCDVVPEKVESSYNVKVSSPPDKIEKHGVKTSPLEKVEKFYGTKCTSPAEKENVPTTSFYNESTNVLSTPAHLIGFPNYGNTCYLNSVIQSLLGLPSFFLDYQCATAVMDMPQTSLFYGLGQVLASRGKGQAAGVKHSLRVLKDNLERVDGSFSGFKMQDANEFLTRVLDTVKDEIDRCHMTTPSPDRPSVASTEDDIFLNGKVTATDNDVGTFGDEREEWQTNGVDEGDDAVARTSGSRLDTPSKPSTEEIIPRNPVKDNFEFQLLESYRCLGCGELESKKQEYFGLYVNLPEEGHENIQGAISSYMGADERELTCEKCKHNRSSVITTIQRLPRILIVQLKRYEYKQEQHESVKMSSRVHVNRWINLDHFLTEDAISPLQRNPNSTGPTTPRASKQPTLTVRNLSSELNMCEGKEKEGTQASTPTKPPAPAVTVPDSEDEELQEVMRRSMSDIGGREDDEIQQAIRLSLQDLGMSYTQDNQIDAAEEDTVEDVVEREAENEADMESGQHCYKLMSIISHFGMTTSTGHYVSDVYNSEESSWFHYDDESVTQIPESVVFADGRQKNGYIFFYVHKELLQTFDKKCHNDR